jgi:hypothetical protein
VAWRGDQHENVYFLSYLALDHRNNLRKAIYPGEPEAVLGDQIVDIKENVTGLWPLRKAAGHS